ncbi:MAG: amidohydrolase [Bacteroidota bacterium]
MKQIFYIALAGFLFSCNYKSKEADLVLHNAIIYTLDDNYPKAQAIAINADTIVQVGAERDILNTYKADRYIDCQGTYVYPGFIDAHCHFVRYGIGLQDLDLVGTKSWDECLSKLKKYSEKYPGKKWINGWGWDQNDWQVKEFPNKEELDKLFPNKAVNLVRIDGHAAIVNQFLLDQVEITIHSSWTGGEALQTEDGKLTGVLIDNAMELVRANEPELSLAEMEEGLLIAQKKCFAAGLTSVVDAGLSMNEVEMIQNLQGQGKLKMQIYAMLSPSEEALEQLKKGKIEEDRLTVRSVKLYGDGALGSRGALLKKPYSDDHGKVGLMRELPEFYEEWAAYCKKYDFQLNTHCIGDAANAFILEMYARHLKEMNDLRWRIEHAQVVDPEDMNLFNEFSIIPSVQPTHATSDMYWAEKRLGMFRMKGAYAYKSLLEKSGFIALGTDFPIEQIYPLETFYSAVFRQDKKGFPKDGFNNKESLTRIEALKGMTLWAALANFEEKKKGSLEAGKQADLTVLNADLNTIQKELFDEVEVLKTLVQGEIVYEK